MKCECEKKVVKVKQEKKNIVESLNIGRIEAYRVGYGKMKIVNKKRKIN